MARHEGENRTTPAEREQRNVERLERALAGRTSFTLLFLVSDDKAQRDRIRARIARRMGGETVRIAPTDDASTDALGRRLAGGAEDGPVQVIEPSAWPEGFRMFCLRLNYARPKLAEKIRRGLLMWTSSTELKELIQEAGDWWCWRSGVLDFTERAAAGPQEAGQGHADPGTTPRPEHPSPRFP